MFATSAGFTDGTVVGGGSIDATVASTETAAYLTTLVVLPPDSEVVAPVSVRSASGMRPGPCSMVEPCMDLNQNYEVIVGHTLADASSWSASVLMVNPNADEIVLPCLACVGSLVPVSAVSVALAEPVLPGGGGGCRTLPDHLEDVVTGSHPSLGEAGRLLLKNLLHRYAHMFSRYPGSL